MIRERELKPEDNETLINEIRADQCHADWLKPAFFAEPHTKSLVYEDEIGPILFLRMSSSLRIHIQFSKTEDKDRIRKALIAAGTTIIPNAKRNGYKQIIFETAQKSLAWFCRRYLGFTASPDEQVLWLEQLESHPETPLESKACESTQKSAST